MSMMTLGGGLAGLLVVGIAQLVEFAGWRGALRWIGLMVLVIGIPLGLNVRRRPADHHQPMDGIREGEESEGEEALEAEWGVPPKRAMRSRAFILLALGTAGLGCAQTSIIVHQVPFLESIGMSTGLAGTMVAVFTVSSVVGRIGGGILADKYDKRFVLVGSISLLLGGMAILAFAETQWQAILALIVAAPGFGGAIPVRPALVADYFGTRYFGTMNGFLFFTTSIGAFFGPLAIGWAVDINGDYTIGWLAAAAITAIAVPSFLGARPPTSLVNQYRVSRVTI